MPKTYLECQDCGHLMPEDDNFCPVCHEYVDYDVVEIPDPKEKPITEHNNLHLSSIPAVSLGF